MAGFSVLHVVKSCEPKIQPMTPPACPNFACQEVGAEVVLVGKEETALSLRFLEIQNWFGGHKILLKSSYTRSFLSCLPPLGKEGIKL